MSAYRPKGRWYVDASATRFAFPIFISYRKSRERAEFIIAFLFLALVRVNDFRAPTAPEDQAANAI